MRYGWTAAAVACLLVFSVQAQDAALQERYSHVQELNNAAWKLENETPRDPQQLAKALDLLHQSLAASQKLESDTDASSRVGSQAQDRHKDALRLLAGTYALQGDREHALETLEALLSTSWVSASTAPLLENNHALDSLHGEPRYQAVIASLKRLGARWKAPAIATSSIELDEAHRIAGLSLFWSEARYNFVYFDHVPELDWNQAYLDFLPKVIAARNLHEYYDVMMRVAPLLRDGHTNIDPPRAIENEFFAHPPLHTEWIDGHVLVTRVDSTALASRVHVGDELLTIDGQDVRQYAEQHVAPYVSSGTPQDARVRTYDYQLLSGDHRQPVRLSLRGASGRVRDVELSREDDPQAKPGSPFEWRMLPGDVAYLAVNEFADDLGLKAFERELPRILKARALILDVRRNGGGSTVVGQEILAYLSTRPIPSTAQSSPEYVPVYRAWGGPYASWHPLRSVDFEHEHDRRFSGPVAVLIGAHTFSAGEDFVMMFDAMRRGTLIGEATGGGTGQPLSFDLPGGGSARVCAKRDTYPDGREFVGKGIEPQITVAPTVEDIRAGRDPVLQRALATLIETSARPASPAP